MGNVYAEGMDANQTQKDDFCQIQNMIDDADSGGSIYLDNRTYNGNGTAIKIKKDISIYGSNSSQTVLNANTKSNIFVISPNVNVNLIGLTFINGYAHDDGGAIYNAGRLNVINSTIANNSAYGGAIHSSSNAQLTVTNSFFYGNHAAVGAAIDNYEGSLEVINSTFIHNNCNEGGAIYNRYAYLSIYDSIFANNTAVRGGGVYNNKGFMKIYNSRFYSNVVEHLGGGIKSFGNCEVYDSIIANNSAYQGGGLFVSENSMKVMNCLVEGNTAFEGGGLLADVGGKLTIRNSRIINNSAQWGGGINMYQGYLTLSDSILMNNGAVNEGGGIFYSDYPYSSEIKNIVLTNNSAKEGGAIYVGALSVKIINATLTDNKASGNGGAISNYGTLILDKIALNSNNANSGGAIYNKNTVNITNSKASGNAAVIYGGVIYNDAFLYANNVNFVSNYGESGAVIYNGRFSNISNSIFDSNNARSASGIYSISDLIISKSEFKNNQIAFSYGVLLLINGIVKVTDCVFSSNAGSDEGGCIFNSGSDVYINNTQFISNKAKSHGAAINNDGEMTIENSQFDGNQAYGAGAIDNGGNLIIVNSGFTNNKATTNGGAIDNGGEMTVVGSIFENNVAYGDGGAVIARRGTAITYSSIYNNLDSHGYAIFNSTWDVNDFSNNWWGCNNPDFGKLFNFNIEDNFTWVIMEFMNNSSLVQGKNIELTVTFENAIDRNANVSKLETPLSLPVFKVILSNGEIWVLNNVSVTKSVYLSGSSISAKLNDQIISLTIQKENKTPVVIKRIINNKDVVVDYSGKVTFKVHVIGDDGKPVGANVVIVMRILGKNYSVKTDKSGWASKTFSLIPGNYMIYASYKGFTVKNKITVKKVLFAKNIIKKKSKLMRYCASLKTCGGKAIVGKLVSFRISGRTYWAKTNRYGIATITLKNLKVGSYNILVKYLNSNVKTILKVIK